MLIVIIITCQNKAKVYGTYDEYEQENQVLRVRLEWTQYWPWSHKNNKQDVIHYSEPKTPLTQGKPSNLKSDLIGINNHQQILPLKINIVYTNHKSKPKK